MRIPFILLTAVTLISFTSCTYDGFTRKEAHYIKEQTEDHPMRLFTIESPSDSLLLRQTARNVKEKYIGSLTMKHLHRRMLATVTDTANAGVGIAAPQVGIDVRMILVQRFDKEGEPFEAYFNPEFVAFGDSVCLGREGCLSVPGYRSMVQRHQQIAIKYHDSMGKKQRDTIEGFSAVIFQHEIDHLNGILYYDRIEEGFAALTKTEQ
jgi:peptide deformylase